MAFRSTYSVKDLDETNILNRTLEDSSLLWFFQKLLWMTSEAAAGRFRNISRAEILAALCGNFNNAGLRNGTTHYQVINTYWGIFLHEVEKLAMGEFWFRDLTPHKEDRFKDLVEQYIHSTLWYAFWNHRECVRPFGDWRYTMKVLRRATLEILEKHSHGKWEKMRDVRDRFVMRWKYVEEKLRINRDGGTLTAQIQGAFSSEKSTWKHALKAAAKDLRKNTPTAGEAAAALVLAWSIDSKNELGSYSAKFSPKFRKAVDQWVQICGSELERFLKICWPSLEPREGIRGVGSAMPIYLLDWLKALPNEAGELPYTERILKDGMDADEVKQLANVSLGALGVYASLEDGFPARYTLENYRGTPAHQFAVDPGINDHEMRMCDIVMVIIIISCFLSGTL
jgi:hypothetical protein